VYLGLSTLQYTKISSFLRLPASLICQNMSSSIDLPGMTAALLSLFSLVVQHPMFQENSQLKPLDGIPISSPFITSEVCLDSKEKEKGNPLEYSNPKTVNSRTTTQTQ